MPVAGGLHYEILGDADAPALLLSAGLGGSATYWRPNLAALTARHRVILYDHRGTGRSDRALPDRITVDDLANDFVTVLDAAGVAQAAIIGHAAGGVAGLALALTAPERVAGLVVVNGWSRPDPHFARCFAARLALLRDSGPAAYLAAQPIFLYPAGWSSIHDVQLRAEAVEQLAHFPGLASIATRVAALQAFDIDARLGEIAVPVLVLAADDDMLVPAFRSERLAAGIPGARLATMTGGHGCNVTEPETFDRIVGDWLATLPAAIRN